MSYRTEKKEPYGDVEGHPQDAGDQQGGFHFHFFCRETLNYDSKCEQELKKP